MLRTKIVCTIGPATDSLDMLRDMVRSGMNVARLNFSHGDHHYHGQNALNIRQASQEVGKPVAILMDLQGPKLRVGTMTGDGVPLHQGEEVVLTTRPVTGHPGEIPVQFGRLPQLVQPGDRILMDDGLLEVVVLSSSETDIHCRVVTGGLLQSNKGMNLPRAHTSIPAITDKDERDLRSALDSGADWIALSFVRSADEVLTLKGLIEEHAAADRRALVMAKIEKPEAMENIDSIIAAADGIMVARGDLGIEASPEEVPMMQKVLIKKCNQKGIPVITATQMLDSMIRNPRPTRAEASDVANAILDGTDALMLSGETAIGQYPLETLRTMVRIAEHTETQMQRAPVSWPVTATERRNIAEAVSHATCDTARDLTAAAIVTPTVSGHTARMVAKYRPDTPIIAVTPSPTVQRQLCLSWGVRPLLAKRTANSDVMLADAIEAAKEHGFVRPGDLVVLTAGAAGSPPGTTNLIKVQVIEHVLASGRGIGERIVHGQVRLIGHVLPPAADIHPSDVLVAPAITAALLSLAQKAAGLVVAAAGEDSEADKMAAELGLTAIIGATDALSVLKEGQTVTLDPVHGTVAATKG